MKGEEAKGAENETNKTGKGKLCAGFIELRLNS